MIWKNLLSKMQKQFKKQGRGFEVDKPGILSFASSHYKELRRLGSGTWNGRYIQQIPQRLQCECHFFS